MKQFGAIFDWDGVIIDSHDQHRQSWFQLADEVGQSLTPEQFDASFGMRNQQIIGEFFAWADPAEQDRIARLGDRKEEIYREIIRATGIEPLAGVRELLSALSDSAMVCAVGSSTPAENIRTVMELTDLARHFGAISAAEDVSRGKPDPEVFLVAAERIGRRPEHCVVFEDAPVGLEAAKRGGMRSIGVATTHPVSTLEGLADVIVEDVTGVDVELVLEVLTQKRQFEEFAARK